MHAILTLVRNITHRQWGALFAVLATIILSSALISQYGFGLHPCHLCIFQRWPYAAAILLGLITAIIKNRRLGMALLGVLAVVFLFEGVLAVFHVGVEYHWWPYNSDCTASAIRSGMTTEQMLAALRAAPTVRCDERVPFLFGMTMAFYNILTAFGLAVLAAVATILTYRSNSLSQYK